MSLARAFTTRRNRSDTVDSSPAPYMGRAASQRSPNSKPIQRHQISLPVALISTTNMLSYDAPNIAGTSRIAGSRNVSSGSSVTSGSTSGDESDASNASVRSRDTVTDASSVDDSYSVSSSEPNHLSCYFKPNVTTSINHSRSNSTVSRPSIDSPRLPQRAPSHSKKAHVNLSHKRSIQRMGSQDMNRVSSDMISTTSSISEAPTSHPFGKELEQLSEVAEEFGSVVRDAEADADRAVMFNRGLVQFCAAEYMQELEGFYGNAFAEDAMSFNRCGWI